MSQHTAWEEHAEGFASCHRTPLNLELHWITTPLGFYALLAHAAHVQWWLAGALAIAWWTSLAGQVPHRYFMGSGAVASALAAGAILFPQELPLAAGLLVAAWLLQEGAHTLSGEKTWQGTYQGNGHFVRHLLAHTWLLVPLLLHATRQADLPFLGRIVPRCHILNVRLRDEALTVDLAILRQWVLDNLQARDRTTHWWRAELPDHVRDAFDRIAASHEVAEAYRLAYGPTARIKVVDDMNEVYVTASDSGLTSDAVFYRSHVDGPWALFPGAAVHRAMVGVNHNPAILTHFPLTGPTPTTRQAVRIDQGDVVSFDYHREPHLITAQGPMPDEPRINLKVHHLVHGPWLASWGNLLARMSSEYNRRARQLFLDTLRPTTVLDRILAALILLSTHAANTLHRHVGVPNLIWIGLAAGAALTTRSWLPWVLMVSFVHYLLYIAVWARPHRVSWGRFVRNAILFKTLSLATLATLVLLSGPLSPLAATLVLTGSAISALAAWRLGIERTWFGVELGRVPPTRVKAFPYGTLPHPMIFGAIVALAGLLLLPDFRTAWPWLVPAHIALYLVHLAQEVAGRPSPRETLPLHGQGAD